MVRETTPAEERPPQAVPRINIRNATVLSEIIILLIAVAIMWVTGARPAISLDPLAAAIGVAVGLLCTVIVIRVVRSSAQMFEGLRNDFDRVVALFVGASVFDLVLISVLAGMCEEALFRGALQTWVTGLSNAHVGAIVAALIFGLMHAISVRYAVFATLLGLVLGYVYFLTGDLLAAMVAHAVYDFVALYWTTRMSSSNAPVKDPLQTG